MRDPRIVWGGFSSNEDSQILRFVNEMGSWKEISVYGWDTLKK